MSDFPNDKQLSSMSISEVKIYIESIEPDDSLIELLAKDPRAGVHTIAKKIAARKNRIEQLKHKQEELKAIERKIRTSGKKIIAGLDEAGRGPLAGPVVAAAVILPEGADLPGLDDSKKLTAAKREDLFEQITLKATAWGIGMVDNEEIDDIGILKAAMKAMCIAVENMNMNPDIALVDGNQSPGLACKERLIVDGDARCFSIAAASIIAKVTRDRIMIDMNNIFPGYGFAQHKGYGTQQHIEALRSMGSCDIHRFSFKIVSEVSPSGSVSAILKKRLLHAPTSEAFDRTVSGIERIREHLSENDLMVLRSIYSDCKAKMKNDCIKTGALGEETSCMYLIRKGYCILDRNWRAERYSYEIDIIARIKKTIVFCEVKTSKTNRFGPSVSWVTPEKIDRISKAAGEYIAVHNLKGYLFRFDVIGLHVKGDTFEIEHIKNAFSVPESHER